MLWTNFHVNDFFLHKLSFKTAMYLLEIIIKANANSKRHPQQ